MNQTDRRHKESRTLQHEKQRPEQGLRRLHKQGKLDSELLQEWIQNIQSYVSNKLDKLCM